MAHYYYIKLYNELLDDPKIGRLEDSVKWLFVELLLVAGEYNQAGTLPDLPEVAWRLRKNQGPALEQFERGIDDLFKVGILTTTPEGFAQVKNFEKRQGRMSGAERVARARAPKPGSKYTPLDELEPDEDGQDIDEQNYPHLGNKLFYKAYNDFRAHRKALKKPMSQLAEIRILNKLAAYPVEVAVGMLDASIANGWQGVFEPKGYKATNGKEKINQSTVDAAQEAREAIEKAKKQKEAT